MLNRLFIAVAFAAAAASPLSAQGKGTKAGKVPPGHLPPAGMCRIWIEGVPPGQQPAPTDCASAVRNRPANARVIFGSEAERVRRKRDRDDDRHDRRGRRDRNDKDSDSDRDTNRNKHEDSDDRNRRRSRDGRLDDRCIDANRDGRCDDISSRSPRTLPEMAGAILIGQGQRTQDVDRWLGSGAYTARYDALAGGSAPERVTWLNSAGQIVQVWVDNNRDGRADFVEVYRDGTRVRTFRP